MKDEAKPAKVRAKVDEEGRSKPGAATRCDIRYAMSMVLDGKTVRRRAWTGNKSFSKDHPAGRVILENADIVADDWEIV